MPLSTIFFFVLAFVAIASALLMITRANPMHGALFLILNFIALAGLYLTLHAQFVAIMQIIVYAGAIMVLVLFVIMLLNLQDEARLREGRSWKQYAALFLTAVLLLEIIPALGAARGQFPAQQSPNATAIGSVQGIGAVLYGPFLFPFEIASILLLAAIVGAVVLAKKRFP